MKVVGLEALRAVFDRSAILDTVREALIGHAQGRVQAPPPSHFSFEAVGGDCHIKSAHRHGAATFAIKVATGFYRNRNLGLPANNGFVAVVSAETGAPLALLVDAGWLTAWRTVAATTLAALALAPGDARSFGVVGAGLQASLALEWIAAQRPDLRRLIWSRDPHRAAAVAHQAGAEALDTIEALLGTADIVVTATPSRTALFPASQARHPRLFIGLGADMPGKQELPPELFATAAAIIVDDRTQALDHGDWGSAVRAGTSAADALMLGDVLAQPHRADPNAGVTIVDLTGIAAADSAIAELFCDRLGLLPSSLASGGIGSLGQDRVMGR